MCVVGLVETSPGIFGCILSKVQDKPHQRKLVCLGEEKTAILIVKTSNGAETVSVSADPQLFSLYEADIEALFNSVR